MAGDLLTLDRVARHLNVGVTVIDRLVRTGQIPTVRRRGRRMIHRDDLHAFLERQFHAVVRVANSDPPAGQQ